MTLRHGNQVVPDRRHRCRCRHCRARQTLNKHPDAYIRPPRCRSCQQKGTLIVDLYRDTKREARRATCYCDGWWFPHRRGTAGCEADRPDMFDPAQFEPFDIEGDTAPF